MILNVTLFAYIDWNGCISSMQVVQVDRIHPKLCNGFFECFFDILRGAINVPVGLENESELGGQRDFITLPIAFKPVR